MILKSIQNQVKSLQNQLKAKQMSKFFKTGQGQYGYGDIFYGLSNPQCRSIAKDHYKFILLGEIQQLLHSSIHEQRLIALVLMDYKFKEKSLKNKDQIFNMYLRNTKYINNWDLVDISAPNIVGKYIFQKSNFKQKYPNLTDCRTIIYDLAQSNLIWDRRIAMISLFTFIRSFQFEDPLNICKILLNDKQDLIHKSVGWMMRQIWSRNNKLIQQFIQQNYQQIPRTTLRYAIQKFQLQKRKKYLKKQF